ncbi:hypothetical protein B0T22DRAFT_483543 [Podospora appendiculata]|uniref:Myb-like domain-containing protein n=1 Tax=Podospora appendiculata TaxID=314037 RepID=A0AAE0X2W5_9PEZI|nr:hypothetical protein B0T22DRAFT_483543 [Podospora appendiculata]
MSQKSPTPTETGESATTMARPVIKGKPMTDSEVKLMVSMFQNLNSRLDVNWEAVANMTGLKDGRSSSARWRQCRKRHDLEYLAEASNAAADAPGDDSGPVTPVKPKAAGRGKKAAAATPVANVAGDNGELAEGDMGAATPAQTPASKKRAANAVSDGADDLEGTPAKKKPAPPRKRGPYKKTLAARQAKEAAEKAAANAVDSIADATSAVDIKDKEQADSEMKQVSDNVETEQPTNGVEMQQETAGNVNQIPSIFGDRKFGNIANM